MSKKIFNVNSDIYSSDAILQAIEAFEGYTISYDKNQITIDDEDVQFVFDEFMNYIISLSLENPI
jgi:hypothetical protein